MQLLQPRPDEGGWVEDDGATTEVLAECLHLRAGERGGALDVLWCGHELLLLCLVGGPLGAGPPGWTSVRPRRVAQQRTSRLRRASSCGAETVATLLVAAWVLVAVLDAGKCANPAFRPLAAVLLGGQGRLARNASEWMSPSPGRSPARPA